MASFSKSLENNYITNKKLEYLLKGLTLYGPDTKWQIDKEGLYEMTPANLSIWIWRYLGVGPNDRILETCGGLGGDTIVLTQLGTSVITYEPDKTRYQMLKNNVYLGGLSENCNYINTRYSPLVNPHTDCNILYMDPPWGGPGYKKSKVINELYLGFLKISDIVMNFSEQSNCIDQTIVLKLPFNYDIKNLQAIIQSRPWRFKVIKTQWIRPPANRKGKVVGIGWFVAHIQRVILNT